MFSFIDLFCQMGKIRQSFVALDQTIFHKVTSLPHSKWLNLVMYFFTLAGYAAAIWHLIALLASYFLNNFNIIFVIIPTELCLYALISIMKKKVHRQRPLVDQKIRFLFRGTDIYSFPSGHAASSFTAFFILARFLPTYTWALLVLCLLICLSRLYLSQHYVSDVLFGMLLGTLVGQTVVIFIL